MSYDNHRDSWINNIFLKWIQSGTRCDCSEDDLITQWQKVTFEERLEFLSLRPGQQKKVPDEKLKLLFTFHPTREFVETIIKNKKPVNPCKNKIELEIVSRELRKCNLKLEIRDAEIENQQSYNACSIVIRISETTCSYINA